MPGHTPGPDREISRVAARQHGVVTVAQLLAAGLTHNAISRRAAAGRLVRLCKGVYAVGHEGLSQEGRWNVAVFAGGEGAALGRRAAVAHWGLRRATWRIDVVTPNKPRSRNAVRFYRCRALDERDVTIHRGIRVTTVARTLVDLADDEEPEDLARLMHEAAYRELLDLDAVRDAMSRAPGRRTSVLDEAIRMHLEGSAGFRSRLEKAFRALLQAAGIAERPRINTHVLGFEVDFYVAGLRLCIEVDGPGHRRTKSRRDDALEDRTLEAAGYTVLRFTDEDVELRPREVLAVLTRYGSSRARPAP